MNDMKKTLFILAAVILSGFIHAQTLQEALKKTDNERFDLAAADYRALIAREPSKGEYYFYFGENYYKNDDLDSAQIFYAKGAEINATNPLNYVGLGKVLLAQGKEKEARSQFFKATTLGANKNAEALRKIAEAWLITPIKNPDEALSLANAAIKIDPKNPENYILLGDAQLEKNPTDGSGPVKSYQMATSLNPRNPKGILREGKLYQRGRNYPLALDYYKKAIALDPNFAPAYREIAELYSLAAQPAKSIENWKKYLELNNSDYARYRFMSALFQNRQYAEAISEYENLKKANFSNLYLERLAAYSYAELGNKTDSNAYDKGLTAINNFFKMAGPNFKYIANDYKYKSLLLLRNGKDSLANIELEKGIVLDSSIAGDIYSEMARTASKNRKYDESIIYFEKKRDGNNRNLTNNDYFDLGKAYYFNGQNLLKAINDEKDALAKKKKHVNTPELKEKEAVVMTQFSKADSAFKQLTFLNT
jgi:tetratricopeptide (TPR) repeat protein